MRQRVISPHRRRKFMHTLDVLRPVVDATTGVMSGFAADATLTGVQCTAPQPVKDTQDRELEIENFKDGMVIFALTMPTTFRSGDHISLLGNTFVVRKSERWPLGSQGLTTQLYVQATNVSA